MKRKIHDKAIILLTGEGRCPICGLIACECPTWSCDADGWYYGVPELGDDEQKKTE